MMEKDLSRRAFLGLGATAAVAAGAGLAGCAPQSTPASGGSDAGAGAQGVPPTEYKPDFLTPPPVPTDIAEEKDCDVLVIGMGLAGTAAAKEAAEAGKKVIVLEKQPEDSYAVISMAGDFGVVGSQIQKNLGIEWAPKEDILNEFVKETGGRCDTWMINYWYDHSGEDFDWFIENADYEVLESTAADRKTDKENYIRPKCFPKLETYNYKEELYPYFHGTITTNPNMQWACQAAFNDAVGAGAELIYEAEGEQLIVDESGTVTGAYAKTPNGYLKVNAKATVICCGDYGGNPEMRHYYAPWGCGQKVGHSGVRIGVRMYPLETRELAVEAVAAGFSLTEAAELAGCSRTAVVNWAKAAGVAPPPRKKAVYLPFDRKMELVARLEAGERAADLAAEAGVTAAAVSGWRRRLREEGALSLMTDSDIAARAPEPREAPSELEELRARCEELELRNAVLEGTIDILKKDPGADLSALTAAERAALADRLRGRFGLRAALAALSLPRSTFYDRLAAASAPDPYAALRPLVRAAFEASGGAYGYRRVRAELARGAGAPQRARGAAGLDPARPVAVSEKVVRRIMAEEGLRARAPRAARYSSYAGEEGRAAAPNLLLVDAGRDLHDFSAAAPGEVLVTDITEFRLPDDPRKVYLSPAVDLFDGDVAAFSVGTSPSKALVAEMLAGAVAAAGGGFTLHSDRGWHYRTPDWVRACGEAGVERSMSRKGHSPDNAACEGFFGRLKVEFFHGRDWRGVSAERFAAELAEWIRWYREGRLKAFDEGGRKVYDTIAGRRRRLGLAA